MTISKETQAEVKRITPRLAQLRDRRSVDTGPEFNQTAEPNELQLLAMIAEKVPGLVILGPDKHAKLWRAAAGTTICFNVSAESPGEVIRRAAQYLGLKLPTPVGGCGLPNTPKPEVAAL